MCGKDAPTRKHARPFRNSRIVIVTHLLRLMMQTNLLEHTPVGHETAEMFQKKNIIRKYSVESIMTDQLKSIKGRGPDYNGIRTFKKNLCEV